MRVTGVSGDSAELVIRSWAELLEAWAAYMRASANTSATVEQRLYQVRRLAAELRVAPALVTTAELVEWLAGQDWSPNTKRAYRAGILAFYRWMVTTGRLSVSPAAAMPPVRVPRGRPRPAPESAFRFALRTASPEVALAIMLAGVCGLRRGEIARARREDLEPDLLGHVLRVVGKGGHVRMVPLTDDLAALILARPDGWLFPSPRRPGMPITAAHLGKLVSECLPAGLTTHTLRHRCGTVAYAATKDLRAVQELLGHAKPETTALYTQVPGASIRAAVAGAA